jgi:hypothetical protein
MTRKGGVIVKAFVYEPTAARQLVPKEKNIHE